MPTFINDPLGRQLLILQWNPPITTTFKMQSIALSSFINAIYRWLEIHNWRFYHTLSSGSHPVGQWPPVWAPEDSQIKYKAVVVYRFHCIPSISKWQTPCCLIQFWLWECYIKVSEWHIWLFVFVAFPVVGLMTMLKLLHDWLNSTASWIKIPLPLYAPLHLIGFVRLMRLVIKMMTNNGGIISDIFYTDTLIR